MIVMAYKCECGAEYSEGLYREVIAYRVKKFEKCECGQEVRRENNCMESEGVE